MGISQINNFTLNDLSILLIILYLCVLSPEFVCRRSADEIDVAVDDRENYHGRFRDSYRRSSHRYRSGKIRGPSPPRF